MTRFFEHKRPDQDTITTQLHRTHLFTSNHPTLTQIVRRNDVITDLYALGAETERSTEQRRIYPNTVYGHAPPQNTRPLTYSNPSQSRASNRSKHHTTTTSCPPLAMDQNSREHTTSYSKTKSQRTMKTTKRYDKQTKTFRRPPKYSLDKQHNQFIIAQDKQ